MKLVNKIIATFFLIFITCLLLLNIVTPDQKFSEHENRMLMQMPKLSFDRIISGKFMEEFEQYIKDQFVWKKNWLSLKTTTERLLQKQENNGVYFGKGNFLFEQLEKPNEQFERNINSVNLFAEQFKQMKTYFLLVPTSMEIYQEKLPKFAPTISQLDILTEVISYLDPSIKLIHVNENLVNHKDENIYFRSDHHWTMRGAYYAYLKAAHEMGFQPYTVEDFNIEIVSKSFHGTLYSKANAYHIPPDNIEVFKPKFHINYDVKIENEPTISHTLYEPSYLNEKDQYSYFLNGNNSLVTIHTNIHNRKKLAVIKDSYAHVFIPFIANHYEEIHVIDLRYYHDNIYNYLNEHNIYETLFLYNIKNFMDDPSLTRLRLTGKN